MEATGGVTSHITARLSAFRTAAGSLQAGLLRMPAFTHSFLMYLWVALVLPVISYGMELFCWSDLEIEEVLKTQTRFWRTLLQVGGRSPNDCVCASIGLQCCSLDWRVRRACLLLRLLNSPPDSLQHLSLLVSVHSNSEWFQAALADLRLVMPAVRFQVGTHDITGRLFVHCIGYRADDGTWNNAQPSQLYRDLLGQRSCSLQHYWPTAHREHAMIKMHIRSIAKRLFSHLEGLAQTALHHAIQQHAAHENCAKCALIARHISGSGPALHVVLDWISCVRHRRAMQAFYVGDFFLVCHAANYFARDFMPTTRVQSQRMEDAGVPENRLCLHCWHVRREIYLENEQHVLFACPLYNTARQDFRHELFADTSQALGQANGYSEQFDVLLSSMRAGDWQALGKFVARIRQARRHMRIEFQGRTAKLKRIGYQRSKAKWISQGGTVCRHGTFFNCGSAGFHCPCTSSAPGSSEAWQQAAFMPAVDVDLRAIVAVPFNAARWQRLRPLQNRLRQADGGF